MEQQLSKEEIIKILRAPLPRINIITSDYKGAGGTHPNKQKDLTSD